MKAGRIIDLAQKRIDDALCRSGNRKETLFQA